MNRIDLESRLIDFTIASYDLTGKLEDSELSMIISNQLIRSALSPSLNYAEAQGAESQKDFVHKLRICLKELRESHVSLKIIKKAHLLIQDHNLDVLLDECNQLISILVKSIRTAQKSI